MGSLLAEISLPKLAIVWMLLIEFPGLLLGAAPLLASIWIASVVSKVANVLTEILPALLLLPLVAIGWFAGRPLLRLAEAALVAERLGCPTRLYGVARRTAASCRAAACGLDERRPGALVRACIAAMSGFAMCGLGIGVVVLVWPASRWVGSLADLAAPFRLVPVVVANSVVIISGYFAVAALIWESLTLPWPSHATFVHTQLYRATTERGGSRICPTSTRSANATGSALKADDPVLVATSGCGRRWCGCRRSTQRIRWT